VDPILDPPYNQHPYGSNYFMLNLLADYREPADVSAVWAYRRAAALRLHVKQRASS